MKKLKVAEIRLGLARYCKFPEGIDNIKDFVAFINNNYNSFVELELFVEQGCVAPFFIEEDLKTEIQYWNTSRMGLIKEDEIFILPRTEYEEELKKVIEEKCINCVHYSEDYCKQDFKPYIEHIALNGECYDYENKG